MQYSLGVWKTVIYTFIALDIIWVNKQKNKL